MQAYVLRVDGSTVPCRIGFEIYEAVNGRSRLTANVFSKDGTIRPAMGADITLDENGVRIFGGNIDAPTEAGAGGWGLPPIETSISAIDYNALAERLYVNQTLAAGTLKSQLSTLISTYLSLVGVTLHPGQVDGPAMNALPCFFLRVDDVLNQLSDLSGWVWNVDYNKLLRMVEPTTDVAPYNITDTNRYAIGDVEVEPSREDYANRVLLLYGDGLHDVVDAFTGNGTTSTFTLTYNLSATRGYVTVNGVTETLGTGATWTVDPVANTITRVSPPAAGAAISINYTAQFPAFTSADAPGGIPTPPGLWQMLFREPDVFDKTTADALAAAYVAQTSAQPRTIRYTSITPGVHAGQVQTIQKAARHVATTCLLTEVRNHNGTRVVTAVEGTTFKGSWRDMIKSWNRDSSGVSGTRVFIPGGGGGGTTPIGPGTPGALAKWLTSSTIGDSLLSESGSTVTVAGTLAATSVSGSGAALTNLTASNLTGTVPVGSLPAFTGDVVSAAGSNILTIGTGAVTAGKIAPGTITNTEISPSAAIAWSKINTTGATFAGFTGSITWAQLPGGSGVWDAAPEIGGILTVDQDLLPSASSAGSFVANIGRADRLFTRAFISQISSVRFDLQTQTLFGGYSTIAKQAGVLAAAVNDFESTVDFGQTVTPNDFVVIRALQGNLGGLATENMQIGTLVSGTRYNVTRNAAVGTAPYPVWAKGTPYMVLGKTGDGRIDMLAYDGKPRTVYTMLGAGPPVMEEAPGLRTSIVPGDRVRAVMGNLVGYYGYTAGSGPGGLDPFGVALGDTTKAWVKIDDSNGVQLGYGSNTTVKISPTGASTFEAGISMGTAGSVTAGNVVLNASGLYIAPVTSVTAFANTNAVRWSTDVTYRTAIWRSDDGSAGEEWHFDHFMPGSPAVPLAFTSFVTKSYAAGGTSSYGQTTVRSRTLDTTAMLQLWAGTNSSQDAFAWFWSTVGGGPSGRLIIGVGTASNMFASGTAPTITTGLEIFGATVTITGTAQLTSNFLQSLGGYVYPGSASGLTSYQTSYYLASHSTWGLYTNAGLYVGTGVYAGTVLGWNADTNTYLNNDMADRFVAVCGGSTIWIVNINGLFPGADNAYLLGANGLRWSAVWAANGTIQTSDDRMKIGIHTSDLGADLLRRIEPIAWQWKDGGDRREYHGISAQTFAAAIGAERARSIGGLELDDTGEPVGLNYGIFVAPLVAGWKDHDHRIAELERRIGIHTGKWPA